MSTSLQGLTILLSGGTSKAGGVVAREATARGAAVVVAGHDPHKLDALRSELPAIRTAVCDLTDEDAVRALADELHADGVRVDAVLHLVGGWRGGGGLAGQSDADFRVLETSLTALRHVSRAFDDDLRASPRGRSAIVSSTAVARPLAGGANYAAVKAASEAWARAVAQGFAKAAKDAGEPPAAASVVFRVKALDGLEETLAASYLDLFAADAPDINDTVVTLS
jgi:NADP-dependent 3-hydroxy acid dehydrogenase YdfG